jgi:RasGEF domain
MVEKLIDVAASFYRLHNYNALAAVLASFHALAITRLKHTFANIPKGARKVRIVQVHLVYTKCDTLSFR